MDLAKKIIAETDWSELEHAYADASDAPFQLMALIDGDLEARSAAVGFLDAAILHQGSVYTATGPAARVVAAMLDDPRTLEIVEDVLPWDPEPRPLRVALIGFLAQVAEACQFDRTDAELLAEAHPADRDEEELQRMKAEAKTALASLGPDPSTAMLVDKVPVPEALSRASRDRQFQHAMQARDLLACRAVAPEIFQRLPPFLDDFDEAVRTYALEAAVRLSGHAELAHERPWIISRLEASVAASSDPRQRAVAARLIGMSGGASHVLLDDEHPGVRACAALAPALADDPRATAEIFSALQDPATADRWFTPHLPGQDGWLRFDLLQAALARVADFETLLPAALAIAKVGDPLTVDFDLGPLLSAAFPTPYEDGRPLSHAQAAFLNALIDLEVLWDRRSVNVAICLHRVGLPHDRDACRHIATL